MSTRLPLSLPIAAIAGVGAALALAFLYAPTESLQGDVQRIFYIHVPAAWLAYLSFGIVAVASLAVLRGSYAWDRIAAASAEIGVLFTTIVLVTGAIWARPVWGTWWVWDARLTTTLVLWAIYAGYLLLRSLTPAGPRRARIAAVLGLIGAIDIPLIHFAVVWWNTQHPEPTLLNAEGPQMSAQMLGTLLASVAASTVLFACLLLLRVTQLSADQRVRTLEEIRV